MKFQKYLVFAVLILLAACAKKEQPAAAGFGLVIEPAFPNLAFEQPVDLQHAPDGTNRIFVVEQRGVIRVFPNDPAVTEATAFLDITDRVYLGHMEEGLLGLAFHPKFKENGYFYVFHTANHAVDGTERDAQGNALRHTVIARFKAGKPGEPVDRNSQVIMLEFDKPYGNHNGGQIAFGPDGYLYISIGDGGSGGDP